MSRVNSRVVDYLKQYCSKDGGPPFAVMLDGKWGSGKTHLVRRMFGLDKLGPSDWKTPREIKTIYASLYGVGEPSQIDEILLRQLSPILHSKMAQLATRALKTAVKITAKVDWDQDGKDDGSLSLQLPDFDISRYLLDVENAVLIFDDLERCEIPVNRLLGYINHFVEHEGVKVILIANESELEKKDDVSYTRIKEKLIGRTLLVKADSAEVLSEAANRVTDAKLRDLLIRNYNKISTAFVETETDNLRLLQRVIYEFEQVHLHLEQRHKDSTDFIVRFALFFIPIAFELLAGRTSGKNLSRIPSVHIRYVMRNAIQKTDQEGFDWFDNLQRRYINFDFGSPLVDYAVLVEILESGFVDKPTLLKSINQNPEFTVSGEEPPWMTIWHYTTRTSEQLHLALDAMNLDLASHKYIEEGEILHAFSLLLWLSSLGQIPLSRSEIVETAKRYIDELVRRGSFTEVSDYEALHRLAGGWKGLGFHERDSVEFSEIVHHINLARRQVLDASLPRKAADLLTLMSRNPEEFQQQVSIGHSGSSTYYKTPVLRKIVPADFVKVLRSMSLDAQHIVIRSLAARYDGSFKEQLASEVDWLEGVKRTLLEDVSKLSPIGQAGIKNWILHYLDPSIERMMGRTT